MRKHATTTLGETKKSILIVDDNQDITNMLSILLLKLGNPVYCAYDGAQALTMYDTYKPSIVILDIGLPDMSGYDVGRALQERNHGLPLLLIALTGYGQHEDETRSARAGFNYHLTKPVPINVLKRIIELA